MALKQGKIRGGKTCGGKQKKNLKILAQKGLKRGKRGGGCQAKNQAVKGEKPRRWGVTGLGRLGKNRQKDPKTSLFQAWRNSKTNACQRGKKKHYDKEITRKHRKKEARTTPTNGIPGSNWVREFGKMGPADKKEEMPLLHSGGKGALKKEKRLR